MSEWSLVGSSLALHQHKFKATTTRLSGLGPKLSTDVNNFEMSTNPDSDSDRTSETDEKYFISTVDKVWYIELLR